MKLAIGILIIAVVVFVGYKGFEYWETVNKDRAIQKRAAAQVDPRSLPGVPPQGEAALQEAYNKGTPGLKEWLDNARRSPLIKDPRLAWVELDYMLRISRENPIEAKRIFAEVKKRTPSDSPVYRRIKELERTYE
jgi:hypothetical protein